MLCPKHIALVFQRHYHKSTLDVIIISSHLFGSYFFYTFLEPLPLENMHYHNVVIKSTLSVLYHLGLLPFLLNVAIFLQIPALCGRGEFAKCLWGPFRPEHPVTLRDDILLL